MTVMTSWDLFEDLRATQDEMLRAGRGHARMYGSQYDTETGTQTWVPAVEISERKDAYLVSAELPGVSADEVNITFGDGLLTITGERHASRDAAGETVHRSERCYGTFQRSITLPSHVQAGKIEAMAQDGVLQVVVPKAPEVQAKHIAVRAGKSKAALGQKSNGS
jgi:HSP20 family protein